MIETTFAAPPYQSDGQATPDQSEMLAENLFQAPVVVDSSGPGQAEPFPTAAAPETTAAPALTPEEIADKKNLEQQNILGFTPQHAEGFRQAGADPKLFAKEHVTAFTQSGGDLTQLRQQILAQPDTVDPVVTQEVERQMFIDGFATIFEQAGDDPQVFKELVESQVSDYLTDYGEDFQEVIDRLPEDQQTKVNETITQIEQERKQTRIDATKQILTGMSADERSQIRQVVDKHPRVLNALGVTESGETLKALLAEFDQESTQTAPSAEPQTSTQQESQTPKLEKKQKAERSSLAILLMLGAFDLTFNNGRAVGGLVRDITDMYVNHNIFRPALKKMGWKEEDIEEYMMQKNYLRDMKYGLGDEFMQIKKEPLIKMLKGYDRHDIVDLLENLRDEDREKLLNGKGQLTEEEVQVYILAKLKPQDLRKLNILK